MSKLEEIRNLKTTKDRDKGLTEFLKDTDIGHFSEIDSTPFCHIFHQFYIPEEGEDKFYNEDIQNVRITKSMANKCY